MPRLHTATSLLFCILTSCGRPDAPPAPSKVLGPKIGESMLDRPFASFRERALIIDRLESPVPVPLTPGSTASSTTLVSDAPDVVTVAADGSLVAHRNGSVVVRSLPAGGALNVTVLEAKGLRARPASVEAAPGWAPMPEIRSGEAILPAAAVTWYSDAPSVAMVEDGRVRTGPAMGVATLTAVYGGEQARVVVNVSPKRKAGKR
jgi:hypothetical protein